MPRQDKVLVNQSSARFPLHRNFVSALPPEEAVRETPAFSPLPARYFTPIRSARLAPQAHEPDLEAALQEMPLTIEAA